MQKLYYHPASGQFLASGVAFLLGDGDDAIQYPANWLDLASDDDIEALGLVAVQIVGQRGDDRFYDNAESMADGVITITATPKPLALCHAEQVVAIKAKAAELLQPTDWMVVRAAEGIKPVPDDVAAYRQAVRDASNAAEAAVLGCEDVDALAAVINELQWPNAE